MKTLNFQKAESFLEANLKKDFELASKNEFQKSSIFAEEIEKIKSVKEENIITKYHLDSLTEVIVGTNAVVMPKDSSIKISLEKIENSWKIVAHQRMIEDILFESAFKKAVVDKLKELNQLFEKRNDLINLYLKQRFYRS